MKGKRKRAERKVVKAIRPQVEARDGYCRISTLAISGLGDCAGPSEWAHFGEKKRARTRGMEPEKRHTVDGSLMLCRTHHHEYDYGELDIEALSAADGTNGRLRYERGGVVVTETQNT